MASENEQFEVRVGLGTSIHKMARFVLLGCAVLFVVFFVVTAKYEPNWDSLDSRPLPEWYDQSKFGIFLHWGVYSVPSYGGGSSESSEHSGEHFWFEWRGQKLQWAVDFMNENYLSGFTYPDFAPMFTAELFDPVEWVELFEASGAKYVVLTSKHHEGWTNWKSETSWNWNSVEDGPHMDIVGALANATRSKTPSIHFGLYFSQFEWFNPLYLQDQADDYKTQTYVREISQPQLHEIVNTYKPEIVWSDGDWDANDTYWNSTEFLAWLYNDSPVKDIVVVNDRWGSNCMCTHGGYWTCHDRFNPLVLQKHKWENDMTIDVESFGFRRDARLASYLSIEVLLYNLITTVSCGGNLLLNVGPAHDGRIVPIFEERLRQMGTWLSVNGEAIYNSTPWIYQNDTINPDVWYTYSKSDNMVYGTLLKWPDNYMVIFGSVTSTSYSKISLLGYSGSLSWKTEGVITVVTLPYLPLGGLQWAWTFKFENISYK